MSSTSVLMVGARYGAIFELGPDGLPSATDTTAYVGYRVDGIKTFDHSVPDPRFFEFQGDDGLVGVMVAPPNTRTPMSFSVSPEDLGLYELISGIKAVSLPGAVGAIRGTDRDGEMPQVGVMVYQMAQDVDAGVQRWRVVFAPICNVVAKHPGGSQDATQDVVYTINSARVNREMWGTEKTIDTDGATRFFTSIYHADYKPAVATWRGDDIVTKFLFPADMQAASTGHISTVTVNGVIDATATLAVDGVTPTTKPADGDMVRVFYQHR